MGTTKKDIREWLERGKKDGATHLIIVVDTFDYDDYPVFVKAGEDVRAKEIEYNGKEMQRVMEVYSLKRDIDEQLNEHRSFNYD